MLAHVPNQECDAVLSECPECDEAICWCEVEFHLCYERPTQPKSKEN